MITLKCFFWSILSEAFHSLREKKKRNPTSPSAPEPDQIQALHLAA